MIHDSNKNAEPSSPSPQLRNYMKVNLAHEMAVQILRYNTSSPFKSLKP